MDFKLVAHCDWSVRASKRWLAIARLSGGRWIIDQPEPVGESARLIPRLQSLAGDGHILIGFDFPIGLPEWYAQQTGFQSFRQALATIGTDDWHQWYDVATHRSEISLRRPFYPMRPGGTRRAHQLEALGVADHKLLLRRCELATNERQAACSLFWTLGGNQVGKGAISGWREVIAPNLDTVGLWPFDGALGALAQRYPVVIAETYPGDVYSQLDIARGGWSKRRQSDRRRVGQTIRTWLCPRTNIDFNNAQDQLDDGFGAGTAGEDRFDAFVGLLGMLAVVTGERPEGAPEDPAVTKHEGWILGHQRSP